MFLEIVTGPQMILCFTNVAKVFGKLVCSQLRSLMKENNIIIDDHWSPFNVPSIHSVETSRLDFNKRMAYQYG